jgi:hypothetical protein
VNRSSTPRLGPQPVPVPLTGCTVTDPPTLQALKTSAVVVKRARLGRIMQTLTTRCLGSAVGVRPSPQVHTMITEFKMLCVDTVTYTAQMIKVFCSINQAPSLDEKSSMGELCSVDDSTELPVAVLVHGTRPEPTPLVGVHYVSGPVVDQGAVSAAAFAQPLVVLLAQPSFQSSVHALCITDSAHRIHIDTLLLEEVML